MVKEGRVGRGGCLDCTTPGVGGSDFRGGVFSRHSPQLLLVSILGILNCAHLKEGKIQDQGHRLHKYSLFYRNFVVDSMCRMQPFPALLEYNRHQGIGFGVIHPANLYELKIVLFGRNHMCCSLRSACCDFYGEDYTQLF